MTDIGDKVKEGIGMAQKLYELLIEYSVRYGFQVLMGLVIILIGVKLASWAAKAFTEFCLKKQMDVVLVRFLGGVIRIVILIFTALLALEKFGVTVSPFVASVGALIFGASFAIQAPLSNYAAGLAVILTRPFTVGNTISVQGVSGVVEAVNLPNTVLVTEDGEKITIPNKEIVGQILYNSAAYKVVEAAVGISYDSDPEKAVRLIEEALKASAKVAQTPPPQIGIQKFGDSSIEIGVRYWVPTREYFQTLYSANLKIFKALKAGGIHIPFPQREVRILSKAQ